MNIKNHHIIRYVIFLHHLDYHKYFLLLLLQLSSPSYYRLKLDFYLA